MNSQKVEKERDHSKHLPLPNLTINHQLIGYSCISLLGSVIINILWLMKWWHNMIYNYLTLVDGWMQWDVREREVIHVIANIFYTLSLHFRVNTLGTQANELFYFSYEILLLPAYHVLLQYIIPFIQWNQTVYNSSVLQRLDHHRTVKRTIESPV